MRAIVIAIAGLMLFGLSSIPSTSAQARDSGAAAASAAQATDFSAAKRRKKQVRPAPQSQFEATRGFTHGAERAGVACTRGGCQPVPRGCLREPERSFDGIPTGFDAIVCPPR